VVPPFYKKAQWNRMGMNDYMNEERGNICIKTVYFVSIGVMEIESISVIGGLCHRIYFYDRWALS
jgi:nucleoside-specific outer membrane channel protein Tsx